MLNYVAGRFLNFVLLVVIAASMGYFLASVALDPSANYQGANPPISQSTINLKLDALNANPDTPMIERYAIWATSEIGRAHV